MSKKEITKLAMEKLMDELNVWEKYRAKASSDDVLLNSKLAKVIENSENRLLIFKRALENIDNVSVELWINNIYSFFEVASIMMVNFRMTSNEKRCIIFNLVEKGIEKGILNKSFLFVPDDVRIQHTAIYNSYFLKLEKGKKIDTYDLCDLRVALSNLLVSKNVVDEIINDIKEDLDIFSGLEEYDDIELSPSMKKLRNSVFEFSKMFVQGNIDDAIIDKIFKYRKNGIKNNLSLLKQVIFGESTLVDLQLVSDVLFLFRTEFKLKQVDFLNIIFEVIERNLELGILEEQSVIFPSSGLSDELWGNRNDRVIDSEFITEILEDSVLNDKVLKNSIFIKEQYFLLLNCYFNKKQSDGSFKDFSLSDLDSIKVALKGLEINDYVLDIILKNLSHKVNVVKSIVFKRVEKVSLNDSEYKKYIGDLKTYIQIEENLPTDEMIINSILIRKFLTLKGKDICVDLMEKLGFSDKVILEFLIKAEKENLNLDIINVIVVYENEVKGWLDFYREYEEYRDRISEIEELYEEFYSCYINKKSEYKDWGSMLVEQIEDFYLVIDSASKRNVSLLKRIRSKDESKKILL